MQCISYLIKWYSVQNSGGDERCLGLMWKMSKVTFNFVISCWRWILYIIVAGSMFTIGVWGYFGYGGVEQLVFQRDLAQCQLDTMKEQLLELNKVIHVRY